MTKDFNPGDGGVNRAKITCTALSSETGKCSRYTHFFIQDGQQDGCRGDKVAITCVRNETEQ